MCRNMCINIIYFIILYLTFTEVFFAKLLVVQTKYLVFTVVHY